MPVPPNRILTISKDGEPTHQGGYSNFCVSSLSWYGSSKCNQCPNNIVSRTAGNCHAMAASPVPPRLSSIPPMVLSTLAQQWSPWEDRGDKAKCQTKSPSTTAQADFRLTRRDFSWSRRWQSLSRLIQLIIQHPRHRSYEQLWGCCRWTQTQSTMIYLFNSH